MVVLELDECMVFGVLSGASGMSRLILSEARIDIFLSILNRFGSESVTEIRMNLDEFLRLEENWLLGVVLGINSNALSGCNMHERLVGM